MRRMPNVSCTMYVREGVAHAVNPLPLVLALFISQVADAGMDLQGLTAEHPQRIRRSSSAIRSGVLWVCMWCALFVKTVQ